MGQYIKILEEQIDVSSVLAEVEADPAYWLVNTKRQKSLREHTETESIHLVEAWSPDPSVKDMRHTHYYRKTELYNSFTETIKILERYFPKGLSRIAVIKLKAGKTVLPHIDGGDYYKTRNRYHLVLTGSYVYTTGTETQQVGQGTLFWFDNKKTHSAFNNTDQDRISVIFDVECEFDNLVKTNTE